MGTKEKEQEMRVSEKGGLHMEIKNLPGTWEGQELVTMEKRLSHQDSTALCTLECGGHSTVLVYRQDHQCSQTGLFLETRSRALAARWSALFLVVPEM